MVELHLKLNCAKNIKVVCRAAAMLAVHASVALKDVHETEPEPHLSNMVLEIRQSQINVRQCKQVNSYLEYLACYANIFIHDKPHIK